MRCIAPARPPHAAALESHRFEPGRLQPLTGPGDPERPTDRPPLVLRPPMDRYSPLRYSSSARFSASATPANGRSCPRLPRPGMRVSYSSGSDQGT